MLTLLGGVLHREGYICVEKAHNGKEAMEKALLFRPEIVFLDIEMPDFNGIDILKAIKEFGVITQIVMVTAVPTAQYVKDAKEHGAAGFLVKPISSGRIVDAIKLCAAKSSQEVGAIELFV